MSKRTILKIPEDSHWILIQDYSSHKNYQYNALVMCTLCFTIMEVNRHNIINGKSKQCTKCGHKIGAKKRDITHLVLPENSNFEIINEWSSYNICHTSRGENLKIWKAKVRCKICGDILEIRRSSLQTGKTLQCNSCSRKGENHPSFKDKDSFGKAISKTMREHPENHPNWGGGITEISKKIRRTREYTQWVKSIYERDNFTCQFTGMKDVRLAAHHKKPLKTIIEEHNIKTLDDALNCPEIWDISNGITMSAAYHMKFHLYLNKNEEAKK